MAYRHENTRASIGAQKQCLHCGYMVQLVSVRHVSTSGVVTRYERPVRHRDGSGKQCRGGQPQAGEQQ